MSQSIPALPKKAAEETTPSQWYVYIVENSLNQLYTGITTDPHRRLKEHRSNSKKAAKALRGKGPLEMKFCQPIGSHSTALKLEIWIKRQSKKVKMQLISGALLLPENIT